MWHFFSIICFCEFKKCQRNDIPYLFLGFSIKRIETFDEFNAYLSGVMAKLFYLIMRFQARFTRIW